MWNYFCGGLGHLLMCNISLSVSRPGLSHGPPVPGSLGAPVCQQLTEAV